MREIRKLWRVTYEDFSTRYYTTDQAKTFGDVEELDKESRYEADNSLRVRSIELLDHQVVEEEVVAAERYAVQPELAGAAV